MTKKEEQKLLKAIKAVRDEANDKVLALLKKNNVHIMMRSWSSPNNGPGKLSLDDYLDVVKPKVENINAFLDEKTYVLSLGIFVSDDELEHFKKVTWPQLEDSAKKTSKRNEAMRKEVESIVNSLNEKYAGQLDASALNEALTSAVCNFEESTQIKNQQDGKARSQLPKRIRRPKA